MGDKKITFEQRRIIDIFNFGAEEMEIAGTISKKAFQTKIYHAHDFEFGGEMYMFRYYTVGRFEHQFFCTVCFR